MLGMASVDIVSSVFVFALLGSVLAACLRRFVLFFHRFGWILSDPVRDAEYVILALVLLDQDKSPVCVASVVKVR